MPQVPTSTTLRIADCLRRLHSDRAARTELLNHASRRIEVLALRMFARFPRLHAREQIEDVRQETMIRLWHALDEQRPESVTEFMGLAALLTRRSLQDLARRHYGRQPVDAARSERPAILPLAGTALDEVPDGTEPAPETLACWAEFHAAADRLPEPERTTFDLLYYNELPQAEAAALLGVTERQVRRYWQSARRAVLKMLSGFLPDF